VATPGSHGVCECHQPPLPARGQPSTTARLWSPEERTRPIGSRGHCGRSRDRHRTIGLRHDVEMGRREDYEEPVKELHSILVSRSRGGDADEDRYEELREWLLGEADLAPLAPSWLRRVRTLDLWWVEIGPKGGYKERAAYTAAEFEPLFEYVESLPRTVPRQKAAPTPRPATGADLLSAFGLGVENTTLQHRPAASLPRPSEQRPHAIDQNRRALHQGSPVPAAVSAVPGDIRVFVVHGRDLDRPQVLARLIEKLGFRAVLLADQPNAGRTIIEKFEDHSEDVAYAIVLMTPDDLGGIRGSRAQPRARQNVILELGFFIGMLKRKNVLALVVGDIETPSDIDGVLYVRWDGAGAWKDRVAREMKAAGLPVDLNKL
jgi:predicted nucleotide-binding protein